MIILGVDPHKSSHTAAAVEARDTTTLDTITISSAASEYRRLLHWSQRWNERYWAIENADGLGHNLTQWLISHGERVVDIPPTATQRSAHSPEADAAKRSDRRSCCRLRRSDQGREPARCRRGPHRCPGVARRAAPHPQPAPHPTSQPAPRSAAGTDPRRRETFIVSHRRNPFCAP
ncbi:IS110 family transposase [Nocardia salmonicida]|uniref:IS110 family transposase n=1 Tax=Nocardia salmonicida TaxID=53431 RepID=UPI003CF5D3AF